MAKYFIESTHNEGECSQVMTMFSEKKTLNKFFWGCKDGDHTAYAIVDAKDEDEAESMVPEEYQEETEISMVEKLTPKDIDEMQKTGIDEDLEEDISVEEDVDEDDLKEV